MKADPDKSHFLLTRIKFLGHIIEENTITPLKSPKEAIMKLPVKIQIFWAMLNFLVINFY